MADKTPEVHRVTAAGPTDGRAAAANIVFIHGLAGDHRKTWTGRARDGGLYWPALVAADLPDVAVWSVSYDASISNWWGRAQELPDRAVNLLEAFKAKGLLAAPLCLVTHSMGGLLAKCMWREAEVSVPYRSFAIALRGVIFLATPHLGAEIAPIATRWLRPLRPSKAVRSMYAHDGNLRALNRWFRQRVSDTGLHVQVYFERESIRLLKVLEKLPVVGQFFGRLGFKVVDETFADLGLQAVTPIPVEGADHLSICKLRDRTGMIYVGSLAFLRRALATPPTPPAPRVRINLGRVPVPANAGLFVGREDPVERLRRAWGQGDAQVVQIFADGGVGKSTIVWNWLESLKRDEYRSLDGLTALDWSFYKQGQSGNVAHSQEFLEALAVHLGATVTDEERKRPGELGSRLADAFVRAGGLLVLDGTEPLQYPPTERGGAVRDPGLDTFLRRVRAAPPPGSDVPRRLVLVTTRWAIPDLQGSGVESVDLSRLSEADGALLLDRFRLRGSDRGLTFRPASEFDAECRRTVAEYNGHALSLVLLASYLLKHHRGDLAMRTSLPPVADDPTGGDPYRHARRVMRSYDAMFSVPHASDQLKGCRQVLLLLGLFDRPASAELVRAVRRADPIPGLTDRIRGPAYHRSVAELQALRLIGRDQEGPGMLDAHPLVRAHFRDVLNQENPRGASVAHGLLFDYLTEVGDRRPETLDAMQPVLQAVVHGCKAGRFADAFAAYRDRVARGDELFAFRKLGALVPVVSALSHFFAPGDWGTPAQGATGSGAGRAGLTQADHLLLLQDVGELLTALEGYAADDVETVYASAEKLAKRTIPAAEDVGGSPPAPPGGRPPPAGLTAATRVTIEVLYGSWRFYLVRSRLNRAMDLAIQLDRLSRGGDPYCRLVAARALATTRFYMGEFRAALVAADDGLSLCGDGPAPPGRLGPELVMSCRSYGALALWHLGRPGAARGRSGASVAAAECSGDPHAHAVSLFFHTLVLQLLGDPAAAETAREFRRKTDAYRFAFWGAAATCMCGWATWAAGPVPAPAPHPGRGELRRGYFDWVGTGARLVNPYWLSQRALAAGLGRADRDEDGRSGTEYLDDARTHAAETGERWWEPELVRLRGLTLEDDEDAGAAARAYVDAIDLARARGSVALELRATVSHARLAHQLGRGAAAAGPLSALVARFTDDTETPDLRNAIAVLASIAAPPSLPT